MIRQFALSGIFLWMLCLTPAYAEVTRYEFSALSKIIALSKDIVTGPITLGVVHNPKNGNSKSSLESIQEIVGDSFKGPKNEITILPIPIETFEQKHRHVDALFITEGLPEKLLEKVHEYTVEERKLAFTTDTKQVKDGHVVIGINVIGTNVKVIINRKTYKEAGLLFDAAFQFIVKEI